MTDDAHVQHTWTLTHPDGREPISIDLWTDGYTVRVDGGPDDGSDHDGGRPAVEGELLPRYRAAGYRLQSDYAVNDPAEPGGEPAVEGPDMERRPEHCPMCGSRDFEYVASRATEVREGAAWLCLGASCAWGEWVTA